MLIKSLGYVSAGVIADTSLEHESYNHTHPSFCGVLVSGYGAAFVYTYGQAERCVNLQKTRAGDVLLFTMQPLHRRLRVMNSRTRKHVEIAVQHAQQPLYLTVSMASSSSSQSQVEFRQVTAAERLLPF